jgi:hypothetical protein
MYHKDHKKITALDLTHFNGIDPTTSWSSAALGFNVNTSLDYFLQTKTELDKRLNITDASPVVRDQLKFILSMDRQTLKDTLKTTYDYDDADIDTMVDRLVYRRVALSIKILPNDIDPQDLHTYLTMKYGSNYPDSTLKAEDKIAFDSNQKTLLAMVPSNVIQEADDLTTLKRTYGEDFILFWIKMSPAHLNMLYRNLDSWLDSDIFNAEHLSAREFIRLALNTTSGYKREDFTNYDLLKKFFIKKYGINYYNNVHKFDYVDLDFYNQFEEQLSDKPIKTDFASKEEFVTHLQNKYKRPSEAYLSDAEFEATDKFGLEADEDGKYIFDSDAEENKSGRYTETEVDDATINKDRTVLYFYSEEKPDNVFKNGFSEVDRSAYKFNDSDATFSDYKRKIFTQERNVSNSPYYVYRIETQDDIRQLDAAKIYGVERANYRIPLEHIQRDQIQSVKPLADKGINQSTPVKNKWYLNPYHNKKYKK